MIVLRSKYKKMKEFYNNKINKQIDEITELLQKNNEKSDKILELQDKVLDLQAQLRVCKGEGWHKPFTYNDALEILDLRKSYFESRLEFARGLPDVEYVKQLMYQQHECEEIMDALFEQFHKDDDNEDGS